MKQLKTFLVLSFFASVFLIFSINSYASKNRAIGLYGLCVSCHGDQAQGKKNLEAPAIAGLPKWYIVKQLTKFKNGGRGKHHKDIAGMRMRPMARTLRDSDFPIIAEYVSKLNPTKFEHQLGGNPEQGKTYYATCMACHGEKGMGNEALSAPPLTASSDWYMYNQLKKFKAGIRGGNAAVDPEGATMMPMAQILPDDQALKDVIAYIQSL